MNETMKDLLGFKEKEFTEDQVLSMLVKVHQSNAEKSYFGRTSPLDLELEDMLRELLRYKRAEKKDHSVEMMIKRVSDFRPDSYVNHLNELILIPKTNLYFRLEDVKTELDFKCKVCEWCTKSCFGGYNKYWERETSKLVNYLLGTHFTSRQFEAIYCRLGNRVNHELTEKFVQSGYDLSLLKKEHCDKCPGGCYKE